MNATSTRAPEHRLAFLFAEEFDLPVEPPAALLEADDDAAEPEIIVPSFSAGELAEARAEGLREGEAAGRAAAAQAYAEQDGQALAAIAAQLGAAAEAAEAVAREAADDLARLLLAGFAALAPHLCARHGEDEAVAILRAVLPGLRGEPRIVVRVAPGRQDALARRLDALDPDLRARIAFAEVPMAPGDVHVTWSNGEAVRNTQEIWREIAVILAPLGLDAPAMADPSSGDIL